MTTGNPSTKRAAGPPRPAREATAASAKQQASKASAAKQASRTAATAKKPVSKATTSKQVGGKATPAKKPMSKATTSKQMGGKATPAKQPASKTTASKQASRTAAPAKQPTAASKARTREVAAAQGDPAARATAAAGRLVAWLGAHAGLTDIPAGATPAALAAVEKAIGAPLPPDLAAWWRLHDGGVPIFEYEGLGCAASLHRRASLQKLRRAGNLADHEVFDSGGTRFAAGKWHSGWIPLAQDGCGNLYCVDLAPGPAGRVGQVLRWEMRGGAFAASSVPLAELLERYADALESGRFKYDPRSGTFDGPYLDLLDR